MNSRTIYPYTIRERWGSQGVNDAWRLEHFSIGKCNTPQHPYLLANEWIAGKLAQFIGLSTPPFALMRVSPTAKTYFGSLRYGREDSIPRDCQPRRCCEQQRSLAAGILIFDIWIANPDRHRRNLLVDDAVFPTDIIVIDHDRALFGPFEDEGIRRLKEIGNRLGITGGTVSGGGNPHVFLEHVNDVGCLKPWLIRLEDTPRWYIEDACNYTVSLGIKQAEADAAAEFLYDRRTKIGELIHANKQEFIGIKNWEFFL